MTDEPILNKPIISVEEESLPEILASGMTAKEAVRRSAQWWDKTGRKMIAKVANTDENGLPVIGTTTMTGLPWDRLSKFAKLRIVKAWHETWRAEQLGTLSDDRIIKPAKEISTITPEELAAKLRTKLTH